MATIDILGVRHAYELTAPTTGPNALVFIHGWLLSRGYWQPLIERLAADYQCLAYDLRGFGQSQSSPEEAGSRYAVSRTSVEEQVQTSRASRLPTASPLPYWRAELSCQQNSLSLTPTLGAAAASPSASCYTPDAYAQDLAVLLQQMNIASAWLIGHSLGGSIGLWAADNLPECVKGVICINAGGGIYLKEAFEQFRHSGQQLLKVRPYWLCHLPFIDLLFTRANVARPIARCWGRQRVIDFVVADLEAALGTLLDSTTEEEINRLPQVVSQLKQPVYFLAGAKDRIMEPKYVRHLASFHPLFQACGDNVIEIPHCGHLAMVEQPDAVAAQIRSILAQHN